MRLIPAAILEPRLRLVEHGNVIEGQAFDLGSIPLEGPGTRSRKASPALSRKVMDSFHYSTMVRNRFNDVGDEGAYYAGTTLPAAIEEIRWHLDNDEGVPFDKTRVYRAVSAKVSGKFLDLRGTWEMALHPDTEKGYPAGHRMAAKAREVCDGIIYPSARHLDGTCIAVFNPEAVSDIRLGRCISFEPISEREGKQRRFGYRMHAQPHEIAAAQAASRAAMQHA